MPQVQYHYAVNALLFAVSKEMEDSIQLCPVIKIKSAYKLIIKGYKKRQHMKWQIRWRKRVV